MYENHSAPVLKILFCVFIQNIVEVVFYFISERHDREKSRSKRLNLNFTNDY